MEVEIMGLPPSVSAKIGSDEEIEETIQKVKGEGHRVICVGRPKDAVLVIIVNLFQHKTDTVFANFMGAPISLVESVSYPDTEEEREAKRVRRASVRWPPLVVVTTVWFEKRTRKRHKLNHRRAPCAISFSDRCPLQRFER